MIDTPDPLVNDPQNATGLPSSRIDDISLTLYFSATSGEEDLHVTEGYVHATHTFQGDMPYPHILSQLRKDYDYSFEGTCEPAPQDQFVFKVSGRTHLVRSPEVIHSLLVTALAQIDTQLRKAREQEDAIKEKPEKKGVAPDSYYSYHQNLMSAIELGAKP